MLGGSQKLLALLQSLKPLKKIADRYYSNELDDEARRYWGKNYEHENQKDPSEIILYTGRGGTTKRFVPVDPKGFT